MTISLRTRLLSGVVVGTGVLLTLFGITIYSLTSRTLVRHFDESLLDTARLLSAIIEDRGFVQKEGESVDEDDSERTDRIERELELEFNVRMTPEFFNLHGGAYYQFWTRDGDKTIRSPSLGQEDLQAFDDESDNPFYGDCTLPGEKPGRAIRYRFVPQSEEENQAQEDPITLVVARDAGELNDFLGLFQWLLIGSSAGIILLSTGVALVVSGAGLRPIHALAGTIRTVNEQTLDQSFSVEAYPVELHPICDCLNALLERIRFTFERERRFNADVAHELRTPLAGIQTTLEVNLARQRNPEEYQQALRDCLAIARSMQKMVDTLLSLSRLDAQTLTIHRQTIPLRPLIESRWRPFADKAYDRGLKYENRAGDELSCACDPDHLSMIFSNIFDNAVDYADEGGRIWVQAESAGDMIVLSVSNTGCTLAPELADRVFDAFWRQDASRTNTGNHCGIGLAVVRKISDALGVGIEAVIEPGGVFTIRLRLSDTESKPNHG
jgi:two-component system, OmpR family, heavy metal sensor histidine kinase CusS